MKVLRQIAQVFGQERTEMVRSGQVRKSSCLGKIFATKCHHQQSISQTCFFFHQKLQRNVLNEEVIEVTEELFAD
jgi:hypothetical protein